MIVAITKANNHLGRQEEPVRAGDQQERVRPVLQQLLSTRFHQSTVVYTDGSKFEGTVEATFKASGLAGTYGLPEECNVFSAEPSAINMALTIPNVSRKLSRNIEASVDPGSEKYS